MTRNNSQFANLILNRLKEAYSMKYDAELAKFLGKDPSTISTWRRRNTIDYNLIFSKCHDLNANFIIHGDLPIRRDAVEKNPDHISEQKIEYQTQNIIYKIDNLTLGADEKIALLKMYLNLLEEKESGKKS